MKFGKELRTRVHTDWASYYIDYKALKNIIKLCLRKLASSNFSSSGDSDALDTLKQAEPETLFFFELDQQLQCATDFYGAKLESLRKRAKALLYRVQHILPAMQQAASPLDSSESLRAASMRLQTELELLTEFAHLNLEGCRKIVKKFDKKLGRSFGESIKERLALTSLAIAPETVEPLIMEIAAGMKRLNYLVEQKRLRKQADARTGARAGGSGDGLPTEPVDVLQADDAAALSAWYAKLRAHDSSSSGSSDGPDAAAVPAATISVHVNQVLDSACAHDALACVKLCLSWKADPLYTDEVYGETPLHTAARRGCAAIIEELCSALPSNAGISEPNVDGQTALHHAARFGHNAAVALLLRLGADTSLASNPSGSGTPLMAAISMGNLECARLLLESGADPKPLKSGITTTLGKAAHAGHSEMVELLLKYGAPTKVRDRDGHLPLHKACLVGCERSIRLLAGTTPDTLDAIEYTSRRTPLHMAARRGHLQAVRALLELGATPHLRDIAGWSAHTHAVYRAHFECATIIVGAGSGCDGRTTTGDDQKGDGCGGGRGSSSNSGAAVLSAASETSEAEEESGGEDESLRVLELDAMRERAERLDDGVSPRSYGHEFLQNTDRLIVSIYGTNPEKLILRRNADGEIINPEYFVLRVRIPKGSARVPLLFKLPLQTPCENEFNLPVHTNVHIDGIEICFEVISIFDESEVLARGVAHHHMHPTDQPHQRQHICVLLDRNMNPIFDLRFTCLLVQPFTHPNLALDRTVFWKRTFSTRLWGHRGAGGSRAARVDSGHHRTHVKENTILSFVTAAKLGAEYVEMDVQMTHDGVPVIYHNWKIDEADVAIEVGAVTAAEFKFVTAKRRSERGGDAAHAKKPGGSGGGVDQRRDDGAKGRAALRRASADSSPTPRLRRAGSLEDGMARVGLVTATSSSADRTGVDSLAQHFVESGMPTLEETLLEVPKQVGFNVELKYPQPKEIAAHRLTVPDMNTYVNTVLSVIYAHAGERNIVFSSFHPDICRLLCLKQPNYPVFFLTTGGYSSDFSDPRSQSLRAAVNFARTARLPGLVSFATPLVQCPEIVRHIKAAGLLLLTYGSINNDTASVKVQQRSGVDAVIVDHVAHVRRNLVTESDNVTSTGDK